MSFNCNCACGFLFSEHEAGCLLHPGSETLHGVLGRRLKPLMKFGTGFFSVPLLPFALPVSLEAGVWYSQCCAGLEARPEVGVVFVEGENGSC